MKTLTLLLISLGVVAYSSAAVINDRPKREVTCGNRIPLAEYFEHGYDITEYDVYNCPTVGGQRAKFVNLNHCEMGKKFTYSDEAKTEYDVPDIIHRFYETAYTKLTVGHTYSRKSDIKSNYLKGTLFESFSNSIDGTDRAMFKNSPFYNELRRMFVNQARMALIYYQGTTYGAVLTYEIYKKDNQTFYTPEFTADVKALPDKLEGNEKAVLDFLKKYGTHVLKTAKFGGILFRYTQVPHSKYSQEADINWEMRKDSMQLNKTADILCEQKSGYRHAMKVRSKERNFTQVMVGGRADLDDYRESKKVPLASFKAAPAMISSEVQPISSLFEDDENKKKMLEDAIKIYMAKAYIKSKVSGINVLLENGHDKKTNTGALLQKAKDSENVYKLDDLNKLGSELQEEVYNVE